MIEFNPYRMFKGVFTPLWMLEVDIPPMAKFVYACLMYFAGEDGVCHPKQETIAKMVGISRRQTIDHIKTLEEHGFIGRDRRGFAQSNSYKFFMPDDALLCEAHFTTFVKPTSQMHYIREREVNICANNEKSLSSPDEKSRFRKPSVDEVSEYGKTVGFHQAQEFVDFYESKGWVVGKSPMKDWKAAVRTWLRRQPKAAGDGALWV